MKLVLTDNSKQLSAEILVQSKQDGLVMGVILSDNFDDVLKAKFREFETLVNQFIIGELLDDASEKIDAYGWQVEGENWVICNLQVFNEKDLSFRIKK